MSRLKSFTGVPSQTKVSGGAGGLVNTQWFIGFGFLIDKTVGKNKLKGLSLKE